MATVYLVTAGSYSDYHVVGAFSTREAAEAVVASNPGDLEVEEYELDRLAEHRWGPTWNAWIDPKTGAIGDVWEDDKLRHPAAGVVADDDAGPGRWLRAESPISAEHAKKLAAEARQEWLRTRAIPAANTA